MKTKTLSKIKKNIFSSNSYYHELFRKVKSYSPGIYRVMYIARLLFSEKSDVGRSLSCLIKPNDLAETQRKIEKVKPEQKKRDNYIVESMREIREFPSLIKKQFLIPNEIFDRKLIERDLLINKVDFMEKRKTCSDFISEKNQETIEKRLRRQQTYILMDISESTGKNNRILLEKAIIFSFLEQNQKEFGTVFFRSYNNSVGTLFRASTKEEYIMLLNKHLFSVVPYGQTDTEKAVMQAIDDLNMYGMEEQTELLLVTDGVCLIDATRVLQKEKKLKINIILIGTDSIHLTENEMREHINKKYNTEQITVNKQPLSREIIEKKKQRYQKLHFSDKKRIEAELRNDYIDSLKHLSEQTGGIFVPVNDLKESDFSIEKEICFIKKELAFLEQMLKGETLSPLEKEDILEEFLALKNYLKFIYKRSLPRNERKKIQNLRKSIISYIEKYDDLNNLLEKGTIRLSSCLMGIKNGDRISFWRFLKFIFYRIKKILFAECK